MTDHEDEALDAALDKAASLLAEHCDSVRIIVTLDDLDKEGGSHRRSIGRGNYYAQYGSVVKWLQDQDAVEE
jgi:hypothetical protein